MSNYLRKNAENTAPKSRRKLWLATGVAGLTGVVSLAGVAAASSAGAVGAERLADLKWSTAEQVTKDDVAGRDDRAGEAGKGQEGQDARGGQDDWQGKDWQGKDGKDWSGKDGKDGRDGKDHGKDAKELPCDTDVLVEAVNRANEDHGGAFKLAKDCTYRFTEETGNNAFPVIDQRITILGNNSTFFHDGTALFRFFEVASGGDLTLKDLTLKGGQVTAPPPPPSSANGGALLVQEGGEATLKHTKLIDNRVTGVGNQGNGGAIANFGTVEIYKSVLANNHARGVGNGGNGGAIYNEGVLTVHDTRVDSNTATGNSAVSGNGGGIANEDDGIATIAYSQITNNKASNDGGGIHSEDDARLTVTRTKIAHNTACDDGGGIHNDGDSTMLLEYIIIAENKATDDGGGVHHDSDNIATIKHAVFTDNTAGDNGGGLVNGDTLNLYDSEFKGNHAEQGGAIYNDNNAVLTIRDSKIVGNFAAEPAGAGGIHNNGNATAVNLDNKTIIKKNEPRNCTNVTGCAN
ncbi:right-handed parallel beta-helix repeat-containing protein [Micromonospora sp. C31]|uniref:right-handed parallel beta-helix repeat-containing protein n=1 Tax=Micromonospora sp. C31 TaxID=2824876 RepID=UPI001FFDA896|nr:right-handed parallel beta-helix repeat-containing protein [Micromonospora sp. C31]